MCECFECWFSLQWQMYDNAYFSIIQTFCDKRRAIIEQVTQDGTDPDRREDFQAIAARSREAHASNEATKYSDIRALGLSPLDALDDPEAFAALKAKYTSARQ